jgi:hypothetical protein
MFDVLQHFVVTSNDKTDEVVLNRVQ